jgi:hypothetical protein
MKPPFNLVYALSKSLLLVLALAVPPKLGDCLWACAFVSGFLLLLKVLRWHCPISKCGRSEPFRAVLRSCEMI